MNPTLLVLENCPPLCIRIEFATVEPLVSLGSIRLLELNLTSRFGWLGEIMRCLDEVGDALLVLWSVARRELLDRLQRSGLSEDYLLDQSLGLCRGIDYLHEQRTLEAMLKK